MGAASRGRHLRVPAARVLVRRSYTVLAKGRVRRVSERIDARGFVAVLYARIAPVMTVGGGALLWRARVRMRGRGGD